MLCYVCCFKFVKIYVSAALEICVSQATKQLFLYAGPWSSRVGTRHSATRLNVEIDV